jgi:hypothetical protein
MPQPVPASHPAKPSALNSRAPPAGIVGAVPVSYLAQLLNQEVACGNARQPRC